VTKRILPTGETVEETYRFVYYGGSTDIRRTTPLSVTPGAVLGAIDIPLAAGKMRALHIRGKVIDGSAGGPARGANVRLIPRTFSAHMVVCQTVTDGNGEFDLQGVIPGSYELYFTGAAVQQRAAVPGVPAPPPPPQLVAMIPIEVGNDDVNNVSVAINAGSTVSGRVTVEGTPLSSETFARIRVGIEPVPTGVAMVQQVAARSITSDGAFQIENIWPARYRVVVTGAPPNTYAKSIRLGSADLLSQTQVFPTQNDGSIEVVLGSDSAAVNGRVANERGDGVSNVRVALVPDAPNRTRFDLYRSAYSDSSGNFRLINVPPGDYKAFAWEEVEEGAWTNADFLRTDESRGKAVRVGPGRGESVSLTAIKR
jgi:hypothetical protein